MWSSVFLVPTGNIVARALRDNNMIVHIHNLNHNMIEKSETDESEMFFSHGCFRVTRTLLNKLNGI